MRKGFLIAILVLLVISSFGQQFTDLYGVYLGQTPPCDIPVVFARGIISTDYQEHGAPAFSPDGNEVFWQSNKRPKSENEKWLNFPMTMRRIGNKWTAPEASPYGDEAVFSPDGKRLYFGSKGKGDDPYYIEKQGNSWGEPKYIDLVSRFPELQYAYLPSIANNGTLYFMGYLKGQWADIGIYRAELINGEYAKPELLPSSINTLGGIRNWTPFIAPDESYLIFCSTRGLPSSDQGDLFICFRKPDGRWLEPISLDAQINTNQLERFPSISPDGKYLFFTRDTPDHDEDVFWVSAKIIDRLKEKNNAKQ